MKIQRIHLVLMCAVLLTGAVAWGQTDAPTPAPGSLPTTSAEYQPTETRDVGVIENLGSSLPRDITLRDEQGGEILTSSLLDHDRPIIVTLGYYECPMLCGLVNQTLLEAVKKVELKFGEDYDIVSVSIDPTDTPDLARAKQATYLQAFGHPQATQSWRFLTGEQHEVKRFADAVGFKYKWNAAQKQYAHAAVVIILTPDGTISRYLHGLTYSPRTLRLSLVEASQGQIGSALDQAFLTCFQFNPDTGGYALVAVSIMRIGGAVGVIALVLFIAVLLYVNHRRRRHAAEALTTAHQV